MSTHAGLRGQIRRHKKTASVIERKRKSLHSKVEKLQHQIRELDKRHSAALEQARSAEHYLKALPKKAGKHRKKHHHKRHHAKR